MEFIYYLILILAIVLVLLATNYYYAPILYSIVIVLSLFGVLLALNSPIQVTTGEEIETYNWLNGKGDILETVEIQKQYESVPLINESMVLLFLASLITAIYMWATGVDED